MLPWIKAFIENHIDLLEINPQEFFLRSWEEINLDRSDVAYMSTILSDAEIPFEDINEWREGALLQILDTQISDWAIADGGVSSMPVYDFIEAFLYNCVGFEENYVLLFMKNHAARWEKWVKIHMLHDMTVISKV